MLHDLYVTYSTPALTWALTALVLLVMKVVLEKFGAGKVHDMIGRALGEVQAAVLEVNQTYVDDIKAASADGVLSDLEKKTALDKALAVAKSNIGSKGLARLARVLGVDVDGWLKNKTEAAVKAAQLAQSATGATVVVGATEIETKAPAPSPRRLS